ncbi:hypothetical protein AAE478_004208 [Parahypoxylon ruwenzoriense]
MGDMPPPIPVVVCGKAEIVGKPVIEGLKPEYEVILFCLGSDPTAAEVPWILKGQAPPVQSSYIGTGQYATPPAAIIMGAAWDAEDVAKVKAAVHSGAAAARTKPPLILRNDTSVPAPPPPGPGYASQLIRRMRACLARVVRGDEVEGPEQGVVWY